MMLPGPPSPSAPPSDPSAEPSALGPSTVGPSAPPSVGPAVKAPPPHAPANQGMPAIHARARTRPGTQTTLELPIRPIGRQYTRQLYSVTFTSEGPSVR